MKRFRSPEWRRAAWLLTAALTTPAGAQTSAGGAASAPTPSPCATAPTFVDTVVSGEARGGALILVRPGDLWIAPSVLRDSETGYIAERVTCDDGPFVRLDPRLEARYNAAELTLDIRPRLDLLPGNTIDLGAQAEAAGAGGPALPLVTLSTRAGINRLPSPTPETGLALPATLSHTATVRAGVQVDRAQASASISEAGTFTGGQSRMQWQGEAQATYDLSEHLSAGVQVYGRLADGQVLLDPQRISGLRLSAGDTRAYRLPEVVVPLPLDADVDLVVNGEAVPRLRARAGNLVLRNIPVTSPEGTLEFTIRDGAGQRTQVRRYTAAEVVVTAHALAAQAEAGWLGTRPAARATAVYGVTDHWSLSGQAAVTTEAWSVKAGARYVDTQLNAGLSAEYDTSRPEAAALNADATYVQGVWRVASTARVLPLNLKASAVGAQVTWTQPRYSLTGRVETAPANAQYLAGLTVNRRVSDQLAATVDGSLTSVGGQLGWKVGMALTWNPTPTVNVVTAAESQSTAQGGALSGLRTQVRYQPAPNHTLSAAAQLNTAQDRSARLTYEYDGQVRLNASAATSGEWSATGEAGLAWVGGRVYVTPDEPGPGVLVRAGVPGVPLLINNTPVMTDARGEALVLLGAGQRSVSVVPNFDRLPVTISVREERRDLTLATHGVTVLDWSKNFARFAWVRLLHPDGTPLKYARLNLSGDPTTDDEGWALVPEFSAPQTVQVTEEAPDAPPCQAALVPGTETVTCVPTPPAAP
ncbi:hypothetical protein [Deinococcus multiflagellatus]|uniref:Fimbrial biogenesis outer membrane usher protein n=1 Tax=Deinococcus multiflagellatus TaxID=1656887 RepID=A0ABW1ZMM5_9DEIO|nr:hypothetical protein [Deinococcus multiflagellatus]MBZ9716024.1 hypothetical protein [Deinococcus multiflagellatus]